MNPESDQKNTYFSDYDLEVHNLKNALRQELGEQGIDPVPFEQYLDIYLLSPLTKGRRYGLYNRMPWQSSQIGNKAIKEVFDELDVVTEFAKQPGSRIFR